MILYNDKFIEPHSKIFSTESRVTKYGDGFFESMRMIHGEIQWADMHAERLRLTAEALMIGDVDRFDAHFLKTKAFQVATKNKLGPHARFRLHIFREGEGLYTPESNQSSYFLRGETLNDAKYSLANKGLIINIFEQVKKPIYALSQFKTDNALVSVIAGAYGKKMGWDDTVILNQDGHICETISSNIFIKYQGKIYTPSAQDACVLGVMRNKILQIAAEEGVEIIEAHLPPEILEEAEEIFLTNAVKGVQWVMGFGKKRYFKESTIFFSEALNKRIEIEG